MECLSVPKLPEGPLWVYEVKLDGYRAIGVNPEQGKPTLFSRRHITLDRQFPEVAQALTTLPGGTVIDGEVVALDDAGRPDFSSLSHSRNPHRRICYYVFDLVCLKNRDATRLPLLERRRLLSSIPLDLPIRLLEYFETSAGEMLDLVRQHVLEGVIAKRLDSPYEPGRRTGAWVKHRVAQQQDFVVGGYMPGAHGIESLIVGNYSGKELKYVGRVRAGLVPATRRELFRKLRPLVVKACPFVNLPERGRSRWGESLTAEKMKECAWVEPKITARIEYVKGGEAGGLRHSRFVRLND
jgi:DNA ligase D-like protein (predicted ligase)